MGLSIERNGYTSLQDLGFDLVNDMVNNGFEVLAVDKLATSTFSRTNSEYLLSPTTAVDPLASEQDQPWRILIEFNNDSGYINMWVLTPVQLSSDFMVGSYGENQEYGRLCKDNSTSGDDQSNFFSNNTSEPYWSCYAGVGVEQEAIPLSYHITITDHGVFISTWAESYDSAGDCFNWVLVQRPVDCNTGQIITDGKSPLVCMFSQFGNSDVSLLNQINGNIQNSILHFIVRENDINAPVPPVSSVVPTADSFPLVNPIQQVALMENGGFVLRFPQGFTTARHLYDYKLDMIAYTSADVLSTDSEPKFTVFGEDQSRTYKALKANFPNNTGMRLLCQHEGQGI